MKLETTTGVGCLSKETKGMLSKGIIFYTDSKITEPIKGAVEKRIKQSGLPITSVSLNKPVNMGFNIVYEGERGYVSYINQILLALSFCKEDIVFFCENDVLYPKDHFDFTPERNDIYYYNDHIYRWPYESDMAITYDRLLCLSGMVCDRNLALKHYQLIRDRVYDELGSFSSKEPSLAREWGYEPGTKKKKRGGLTDEDFETFHSKYPIIDIRHQGTFSPPKVTLESFRHKPNNWRETPIKDIPGWNLKEVFNERS